MQDVARILAFKMAVAAAVWGLSLGPAMAQEAEEEQAPASAEVADSEQVAESESTDTSKMEEIVVISPRPGSRRRLDEEYEDPVRAELLKEFYRMQELDEEYAWRDAAETDANSRIKWGYDPREEYRMRNDSALQDLSWEKTKPATLFRVEF